MKYLFAFLWRYYFFFLFLILEVICLLLFINNNRFPKASALNALDQFSGACYQAMNDVTGYFNLRKANKLLAEENAKLHALTDKSFIMTDRRVFSHNDTLYKQEYEYLTAKVISNSVNRRNNYLVLNKGLSDGIGRDMAVFSPSGIVGIVKDVSHNFSSVISVLHKETKISGKIKKNGFVGTVEWDGLNYRNGLLKDIPVHVKISPGDTVVTSGYSMIFPQGILIGTILDYNIGKGENFYTIRIRFSTDFNNISYVYVVRNLMGAEQRKFQEQGKQE